MKQLVILSGKGGTGKTSVAASFAHLAHAKMRPHQPVLVDTDVDAANLELVLRPQRLESHEFFGGELAVIDPDRCQGCGICEEICRFGAILGPRITASGRFEVDPIACDGCAACAFECPDGAISMQSRLAGHWFQSLTPYGRLFHAELRPAQDNSGKLVTLIKQHARLHAIETGSPILIVDGPPGIGCPAISAAAGADLALIVAEPGASGISDMVRILQMTAHFRLSCWVCINKADLYPAGAERIQAVCGERGVPVAGCLPYDEAVTRAMVQGEPVTVHAPNAPVSQALGALWQALMAKLDQSPGETLRPSPAAAG